MAATDASARAIVVPAVAGKRVTVMGLGRHGGGVGAARYLASRGALVTVTDRASEHALGQALDDLADVALERICLGRHEERDFLAAQWLVVNPAVPPTDSYVQLARRAGAVLTTEIELFLNACPATIVGVTGSNGKSTTAAMTAEILSSARRKAWLGGNIGRSLLSDLPRMRPGDVVVLELSSFQLARLSDAARPVDVAVVTNCTPNHLDWHGGWTDYVAAKQRLLELQTPSSQTVLNPADGEVGPWQSLVRGTLRLPWDESSLPALLVLGEHNRRNAAFAAAAAQAVGCSAVEIQEGLAQFAGLPYRLQLVGECAGRQFYNDSLATTPESTCAALEAFEQPSWFLVGGYDKGCDLAMLVEKLARHARGVALYGASAEQLGHRLKAYDPGLEMVQVGALPEALAWCWDRSRSGDTIVLSPGFASYDQYRDYAERGEHFELLVAELIAARRPGAV